MVREDQIETKETSVQEIFSLTLCRAHLDKVRLRFSYKE